MRHYAVVFFIIALIAAFFGFGGIAVGAAGIAKVLYHRVFDRRGRQLPDEHGPSRLAFRSFPTFGRFKWNRI
jgi:uncharacterized membrane protein YtjA (UPF0391 family)